MQRTTMSGLYRLLALAFASAGFPLSISADAATMESLQNRLIELQTEASSVQARADAEQRQLTTEEADEIDRIVAAFTLLEEDIARRERVEAMSAKLTAVPEANRSRTKPVDSEEPTTRVARATAAETRMYATPNQGDAGKYGFRSAGEFLRAVVASSAKGATPDPRLIKNAAPGTFGSEGTGSDGGFAVPPDFRQAIITKIMGEDSLLSLTDQQTASGNSITFPVDETTPWQSTGGIQAYWENEGGQKTPSKPALTEKNVRLNKVIALVPLTDELLEDAPAMSSYVNKKAPEKITYKVNDAIINGTGVGQPLGILNSPGTIVVAKESGQAADSLVYQNIVKLWTAITPSARRNAKWVMNADVEGQLMSMAFPNGGSGTVVPVYLPPGGISGAPYSTLFGREIVYTEAAQALGDQGDILFGDFSSYLSVVKSGGIKTDVSIHLWFDYDITAFRFVLRVGGQPWFNSAIQPAHVGSTARGFFATLAARA